MKTIRNLIVLFCILSALTGSLWAQEIISGKTLVKDLRKGGFNIYFRHAATDWSREDNVTKKGDWQSCDPDKMRQLVPGGRAAARKIGAAIRRLKIPVGRVWSSPYCRTRETARHLNLGPISITYDIMNLRTAQFVGGHDALVSHARRALATPPPIGTNTVFVAHGNLVQAATGAYPGEAGAAIFNPLGNGRLKLVALLNPEDWEALADNRMPNGKP